MPKKGQVRSGNWLDLLVFVLFVNLFIFREFGAIALWLVIWGVWVLVIRIFGSLSKTKHVARGGSAVLAAATLVSISVVSEEKTVLLVLVSLGIIMVSVYTWLKQAEVGGILELGLSGFSVIREYLRSGLRLVRSLWVGTLRDLLRLGEGPKQKSPWLRSIGVGLLVSLPLVAWLLSTLAKADPVFAGFIKDFISAKFLAELPARIVLSMVLTIFLVPILIMAWRGYETPLGWLTRARFGREMTVVTGMVGLILGIFLMVQWPYVFANVARETELTQFGVATYSEYVQKGFWDLLKVVVMVFGVSWIGLLVNKNQKGVEQQVFRWVQGILGVEFVIFIISIFRRVWLYQSYHGLTLARLYGLGLLIGIVGMMATMALRYVYPRARWVKIEMAWIIAIIFGAILINMESLVVKVPPTVNARVDYVYLSRLSADGYAGWVKAYGWASRVLEENAEQAGIIDRDGRRDVYYAGIIVRQLTNNFGYLVRHYGTEVEALDNQTVLQGWDRVLSWNWTEQRVYNLFKQEIGIEKLQELQNWDRTIQEKISKQHENERDYEVDVSLDSPFLR